MTLILNVAGRLDIDINLVEDSMRLAKQCKMTDLIEELENKCKQVYEFGKTVCVFVRDSDSLKTNF